MALNMELTLGSRRCGNPLETPMKTLANLVPLAIDLGKQVSAKAENHHRSRLEGQVHGATNAEIRKATRQEDGVLRSVFTSASSQRSQHLERTRALPSSEVKSRIQAQNPSVVDSILGWLY